MCNWINVYLYRWMFAQGISDQFFHVGIGTTWYIYVYQMGAAIQAGNAHSAEADARMLTQLEAAFLEALQPCPIPF